MSDLTLALLFKRCWISYEYVPGLGVDEITWPPALDVHQMMISADLSPAARRFAMRHGLAHVLAGHTCGANADHTWMGSEETVADLFAIVEIVSEGRLEELRAAGYTDRELERWIYAEIASWTNGWPPERLADRTRLRIDMGRGA